jgi:hypothetical protein
MMITLRGGAAIVFNKKEGEEEPIIMTPDIIQNRRAYSWFVCQKCKSPESPPAPPLGIVPRQLLILCEDCFLHYSKILPVEDREFVSGHERESERYDY